MISEVCAICVFQKCCPILLVSCVDSVVASWLNCQSVILLLYWPARALRPLGRWIHQCDLLGILTGRMLKRLKCKKMTRSKNW